LIEKVSDSTIEQSQQKKSESRLLSMAMAILTASAILAASIAVPVLCRPFYYGHITPLQIRLRIMLSEAQIKETYDEIMDYCLGMSDTFEMTHLPWSADGASHFADVRMLFLLDLIIAVVSVFLLVSLWTISSLCKIRPARIKGHIPAYWAAAGLGITFMVLGILAAINFDGCFTAFHTVFFPGRDNWIFDAATDPVINMLPQVFFRNCAVLVFVLVIVSCGVLLMVDKRCRKGQA